MSDPCERPTKRSICANRQSASDELESRRRKYLRILAGIMAGGLLAPMVGLGLAFIVLLPPMCSFFGLDGEFDGIWVVGIPIFALPCGIIGGLVFSGTWKRRYGYAIASACASLPAFVHFFANAWAKEMTKNPRDVFASTLVISICMVLSAVISLKLVATIFVAIERYRSS